MRDTVHARYATPSRVREGRPFPQGATFDGKGTNFALFSAHATRVDLCLFDDAGKFLGAYIDKGIFEKDPFVSLDQEGVGDLIRIAAERGISARVIDAAEILARTHGPMVAEGRKLLADTLEEALELGHDILVMRDGAVSARFDLSYDTPTTRDLLEKMV